MANLNREITVVEGSTMTKQQYADFLKKAYELIAQCPQYICPPEDINVLELAHLVPVVDETVLAIYLGINDAVCNKGLVTPLLPQHGHNNVFVFDNQIYSGGDEVPSGTIDAQKVLVGFEPPNETWNPDWTYVMIADPARSFESLWAEKGYIDMIPAKFEDFTNLTDLADSKICFFITPKSFDHPVNQARNYLKAARDNGQKMASEFTIPERIKDEFDGLEPVILEKGQKLYVATNDFGPCAHGWSNIHPANKTWAVINENSAVPLDLVIKKPPVKSEYAQKLIPPKGSSDMTTDWFFRGDMVVRKPLLQGIFKG